MSHEKCKPTKLKCYTPNQVTQRKRRCTNLTLELTTVTNDDEVLYVFRVRNRGAVSATAKLHAVLVFDEEEPTSASSGWEFTGNLAVFDLGIIGPGFDSGDSITIAFSIEEASAISAAVFSNVIDCNSSDNVASASFQSPPV